MNKYSNNDSKQNQIFYTPYRFDNQQQTKMHNIINNPNQIDNKKKKVEYFNYKPRKLV